MAGQTENVCRTWLTESLDVAGVDGSKSSKQNLADHLEQETGSTLLSPHVSV